MKETSLIDFVIVPSSRMSHVLDTRVESGAELSTDHYLVVSQITLDEPGKPKQLLLLELSTLFKFL